MQSFENLEIKSVETILITPEIARVMMSKNNGNRRVAPNTVNYYSQMMKKGNWKSTHQGLAIDESGNVIDGQHRLAAVIKSGISILTTLTVYKGKIKTMMIPVDVGKNRNSHDLTGLSSGEISIFNAINYLFPNMTKSKVDPVTLKYMSDNSKTELEYLTEVSTISYASTPAGYRKSGLARIWNGGVKAACLAGIIENIDISVVREFNNVPIKRKDVQEYYDFVEELAGLSAGTRFIITIMPMFWNIIKYKTFISQNEYEKIDANKTELRKIFRKKYPEVFV